MDNFPYVIYRGDTRTIDFTVTEDSVAFDISGSTIKFTGKKNLSDADTATVFDVTCTLTTPLSGECSAEIQITNPGVLFTELEYRKDTTILTLKQWKMTVSPDVRLGT